MNKLFLIANLFIKTVLGNRAVLILSLLIGGLLLFATFSGWSNFKKQEEVKQKYQAEARRDWLNNPDKNPHRMAHFGHFAFRPKTALSAFDFGMDSFLGNTVFLEAHKQNTVNFSEASFSTGLLRFGEISVAMILQLLLPLFLIFIGFSSISSERESGMLKMLLSQGLTWKQLIVGKSLGLVSVMSFFFFPTMILVMSLWATLQDVSITEDNIIRMTLLSTLYFTYLSIFCVIIVLISAVSNTSKTALTTLIGLWLLFTIILPRVSQALGNAVYELPSKVAFEASIEQDILKVGDSHNSNDPYFKALKDSLLTVYKVDSVQQLPFNYKGFQMKEGERISSGIYSAHQDGLFRIFAKQNSFSQIIAFVNPFTAVKNLSMALTGTDFASYAAFQRQAESYRFLMAQKMNDLQIKYVSNHTTTSADKHSRVDKKMWKSIPDFRFEPLTIAETLQAELNSLIALFGWVIILFSFIHVLSKSLKAI